MAWTNSRIFAQPIHDILTQVSAMDLDTDTFKGALYNNTTTPDNTVASASAAYNTGVWAVANEVSDGTNWDAAGEPLTSVTFTRASAVLTFDAADLTQGGATCTLSNVYGTLVYSDTIATPVADLGLCYNYFGGAQSVTAGTFTVQWHANGICTFTLT